MFKTFNMGIGFILAVDPKEADAVMATMDAMGEKAYRIGTVTQGEGVRYIK